MQDIQYAFRMFRRAPLVALTIVIMVALGLGLVAMVFTFLNLALFRIDNVRNPGELAGIERPREAGSEELVPTTRAQYEALRRETAVFSDAVGIVRGNSTRVDGRVMSANLVTGNFFQVLGVEAAHGRTLMPDDDRVGAGRAVIVMSHTGWLRRFDGNPAVVGSVVRINGFQYEIVGIAPEGFRGLAIGAPDFWAPAALAGHFRPEFAGREGDIPVDVIGRLKPGVSMESGAAGLVPWATRLMEKEKPATGRPAPVRLEPRQGTVADDTSEVLIAFTPLFLVFGLVLLIPCANVTNLLLARGVARQREIGIRLSIGATRPRIVRQLLTESLILALIAAAGGFIVSRATFVVAIYALSATLPPEIAESVSVAVPPADWRVILFLLGGAAAATVFFGLTPALRSSRVELVRAMRGEVTRDGRPGRTRNRLITAQVGASALLLVSAMVLLRGAFAAALVDPGLRTHDTVTIEIPNEPMRAAVVDAVAGHPSVAAVAASLPGPVSSPFQATARTTDLEGSSRSASAAYRYVSVSYFAVLDIPVVRGRGFTDADRSKDTGVVMVAETLARTLWPDGSAIGRTMSFDAGPADRDSDRATPISNRTFTVVGIVRDVPGFSFDDWPLAVAYFPTASEQARTVLTVRVNGDPDSVRAALFDRLSIVDPAITRIATLRVAAGLGAYLLGIAFWVSVVLGGLALLLTVVGLFSVLSYLVEEREKEIGVRLALGAPPASITRLVQSQMMRPVAIGMAGGAGLAAALAVALVASPLGSELSKHLQVLDPIAYVTSLTCIIVACLTAGWVPARRAARIDPIETLRRE